MRETYADNVISQCLANISYVHYWNPVWVPRPIAP